MLYVGRLIDSNKSEVFEHDKTPTREVFGKKYSTVIGDFKTKEGAEYMCKYGENNPHVQTVEDAERLAKKEKK